MRKENYQGCSSGKVRRTVRMRHKFTIAHSIVFATALFWCAGGCDPVTRHKYLTYFVDGVPPLGSEQDSQNDTKSSQKGSEAVTAETEKKVWFVHEPARTRRTCPKCHEERGTQSNIATARLIKPNYASIATKSFALHSFLCTARRLRASAFSATSRIRVE